MGMMMIVEIPVFKINGFKCVLPDSERRKGIAGHDICHEEFEKSTIFSVASPGLKKEKDQVGVVYLCVVDDYHILEWRYMSLEEIEALKDYEKRRKYERMTEIPAPDPFNPPYYHDDADTDVNNGSAFLTIFIVIAILALLL